MIGDSNLTIGSLRAIEVYLLSLPPIIHTLWFVDSHRAYWRYRAVIGWDFRMDVPRAIEWYAMFDCGEPRPDFCSMPGVWAQFTDGADRQMSAQEFDAFLAAIEGAA